MTDATQALSILFDDEHLLVVDKPAGVVVHPAYKNPSRTLLDALAAMPGVWGPGTRPSIVGRLDKLTSGLVIVAKSAETHARLQRALAAPTAEKAYIAVTHGAAGESGVIELALASDPRDRRRRIVDPAGAPSLTRFERLASGRAAFGGVSLLRCLLVTGRRHQIRVHLAARGWPIVGDAVYGQPLAGFPRVALHSWRVRLTHPMTGAPLEVEAPLPDDLAPLIAHAFGAAQLG